MAKANEIRKIRTRHPQPGKQMPRIDEEKYQAVRRAILRAVPKTSQGVHFGKLSDLVSKLLSAKDRRLLGSVGWYTAVVKLDLEARGKIQRIPGSRPQRLRRSP